MFERLKYLYNVGRLTEAQLEIGVSKGWITEVQKEEIVAEIA
ncbi:XkdX family protein [Wukongibacter sp. M2B1]